MKMKSHLMPNIQRRSTLSDPAEAIMTTGLALGLGQVGGQTRTRVEQVFIKYTMNSLKMTETPGVSEKNEKLHDWPEKKYRSS